MASCYFQSRKLWFESCGFSGLPVGILSILFLIAFCYPGLAEEVKVDSGKVYYGDANNYTTPAQVELNKVFAATKEYKQIKKEKIKTDDPLYLILLNRANERVQSAIKKVAEDKKYDLVGELGYITGSTKSIPNITDQVIKALDTT